MEVAKNTAFKNMKAALAKQSSDGFSNIVMNKGKYVTIKTIGGRKGDFWAKKQVGL